MDRDHLSVVPVRDQALTYWDGLQRPQAGAASPARRRHGPTALVALLVAAAVAVAGTRVAGLEPLTVLTGSMRPAIDAGDLVLVARDAPTAARPGDVITFRSPDGRDRTVTHRVVSTRRDGPRVRFTTQGDASPAPERWSIDAAGRIGRVRAVVPFAGRLAHPLSAGWTRGVALLVLTVLGSAAALWLIWRPGGRR